MPKKLTEQDTEEALEEHVLFTQAALAADPDAADLVTATADWFGLVDQVKTAGFGVRQATANVNARRIVADVRLDTTTQTFGRALLYDVADDRSSPRWRQFFDVAPGKFVKQAQPAQARKVKAWLSSIVDPVLDRYREPLTEWSEALDVALTDTAGLASVRARYWQTRGDVAAALTKRRDSLHGMLVQRAQERGLPREWADAFFYIESKTSTGSSDEASGADTPIAPAATTMTTTGPAADSTDPAAK